MPASAGWDRRAGIIMKPIHYKNASNLSEITIDTELQERLSQHNLRVTLARKLILRTLFKQDGHVTVDELLKSIWHQYPNNKMSLSGVYGNLKKMADSGVVRRRCFGGKYIYSYNGSSILADQLIEVASGRVVDLNHESLEKVKAQIAGQYGFSAENCRIELHAYPNDDAVSMINETDTED